MEFSTDYNIILQKIQDVDPLSYAQSRNFLTGAVSYLSPYISRGVISLKQIQDEILRKGYGLNIAEKFLQELAWREYYQRLWQAKEDLIWEDLNQKQPDFVDEKMILSIVEAKTGIIAIDAGIRELYKSGYMHNHLRMYVASIVCNIGKTYWKIPSKWLYFNLLDGDIASNNASWQWVAAAFSSKKYYCNQENINKYTGVEQSGTFLYTSYEELPFLVMPEILKDRTELQLSTILPETPLPNININHSTIIYNSYNLDPIWRKNEIANRILLFEPSHFTKYPVSENVINFIIGLSANIPGIQIFCGELSEISTLYKNSYLKAEEIFISKAHPAFNHYPGVRDSYEWMFPNVSGAYPSFFKYWKLCRPYLEQAFNSSKPE